MCPTSGKAETHPGALLNFILPPQPLVLTPPVYCLLKMCIFFPFLKVTRWHVQVTVALRESSSAREERQIWCLTSALPVLSVGGKGTGTTSRIFPAAQAHGTNGALSESGTILQRGDSDVPCHTGVTHSRLHHPHPARNFSHL